MATETEENHLGTHVAVCRVRYLGINARLARIEKVIAWAAAGLITALGFIAWQLVKILELSGMAT